MQRRISGVRGEGACGDEKWPFEKQRKMRSKIGAIYAHVVAVRYETDIKGV